MQLRGTDIVVDKVRARQNVISGSGATATLSPLNSGSLVLMDRAAGIVFTLPTATSANVGMYFDFQVLTSVTSNSYKVTTAVGTELLSGSVINIDTDTSNAVAAFTPNGTTHVAIAMNGTTTGGLVGTTFRVTCISTTRWMISGITTASGTVATPFST